MAPVPDPRLLRDAFGWPAAELEIVHRGENTIWRAELPSGPLAVRVYRPGRRSREEIEAEWAWAEALGAYLETPQRVAGPVDVAGTLAVAMTWAEGRPLELSERADVRRLGELVGTLCRAAREIEAAAPAEWIGHRRPRADPIELIDGAEPIVSSADFVSAGQRARFRESTNELRRAVFDAELGPPCWVHADLHAHNVLCASGGEVVLLDLDDAVRGPRAFELATPRTHLRARTPFETTWPHFAGAARLSFPEREIRVATAVHLVDTMAEFPSHLDMIPDPQATVERYLGYLAAELEG